MHTRRSGSAAVFAALFVVVAVSHARSQQILPATAYAWPNGRTYDHEPFYAVDGDVGTFTWTTDPYTADMPAYLGLDFGAVCPVVWIRLWKDNTDGCGNEGAPDLVIQYTTDTGPMPDRTWLNVSNLRTLYYSSTSIFHATAINADGSVQGDVHDSINEGHGWGELAFDPVLATGVRIAFWSRSCIYNHYCVYEFQASGEPPIATEPSTWGKVKSLYRN